MATKKKTIDLWEQQALVLSNLLVEYGTDPY